MMQSLRSIGGIASSMMNGSSNTLPNGDPADETMIPVTRAIAAGMDPEKIAELAERGVGPGARAIERGADPAKIAALGGRQPPAITQPAAHATDDDDDDGTKRTQVTSANTDIASQVMQQSGPKVYATEFGGPGTTYLRPELRDLKIIGVEEHCRAAPGVMAQLPPNLKSLLMKQLSLNTSSPYPGFNYSKSRFQGPPEQRIKDMDENMISFQVLSRAAVVNALSMPPKEGTELTRALNDDLKRTIDQNPSRFAGLGELPFQAPDLAIKELRRCVKELGFKGIMLHGSVDGNGKFLDLPEFDDLLSEFERLDVPLYLHPGLAPKTVVDAYYTIPGKPELSTMLAGPGWGWHQEVGVHVIRLAISGALDQHPNLKLVIGHQGEMMPMFLQRFESMFDPAFFGFKRSIGEMLRSQVHIAISGFFSIPLTQASIQTWGVDRVLFANDYPFVQAQGVPDFVKALGDVVAPSDMKKICQTNAEKLFKIKV